ncbi:hypothetical protein SAMN02787142_3739 [Burkholderia sp. WP9]|nr:hypothetical protein SAMN02787142_3739 [Burkholderia sp. WP9]
MNRILPDVGLLWTALDMTGQNTKTLGWRSAPQDRVKTSGQFANKDELATVLRPCSRQMIGNGPMLRPVAAPLHAVLP